ncbi:MAG: hypothetical protein QG567_1800 [Campylobacterota bacterium]|nr:hypothetical protein [Campylobacterota bacterium]
MEYVSYIVLIIFSIFVAKRFFFVANYKVEKEEPVIEQIEEAIEEETTKEIEEIFYELNTHDIKINLFPASTFSGYSTMLLYKKIIVDNYWIEEPFHSSFTKILCCIDENNFWIQSSRSKEIIINFRNFDGEEERDTAVRVFDLKEILNDVVLEIDRRAHRYLSKQDTHILLLSSMIYTISKCGNLDILIEKKEDDLKTWSALIEIFCMDFSEEIKNKIIPKNNINIAMMQKVYYSVIEEAREYPNHLNHNDSQSKEPKMLSGFTSKQLISAQNY